ncbi:hypothetical protein [Fundidesulfovibrio putealis]|uniref:hypothetical protein n=1 Tax=Fundidesulfovibrio putealis TaxID=270496 RepID=UPI0004199935|nr:hypothetical protein [Fundidesulfovibrio putealis]
MSLARSNPLPAQAAPLIELRFLVPPAMVETARQAMAPYARASVLPEGSPGQPATDREHQLPAMPVTGLAFTGVTRKELEALLRE